MKAWMLGAALALWVGAASADLEVLDARIDPEAGAFGRFEFDVANNHEQAVAEIEFRLLIETPEREVPWVNRMFGTPIAGGIEPGEQYTVRANAPSELMRGRHHDLTITIEPLRAYGADGELIE